MTTQNKSPDFSAWTAALEVAILESGRRLARWQAADAQQVGVRSPERVRVLLVDVLPTPGDPELRAVAASNGLLDGSNGYLTFGYAIMILHRHLGSRRILRRALAAVAQFELAESRRSLVRGRLAPQPVTKLSDPVVRQVRA